MSNVLEWCRIEYGADQLRLEEMEPAWDTSKAKKEINISKDKRTELLHRLQASVAPGDFPRPGGKQLYQALSRFLCPYTSDATAFDGKCNIFSFVRFPFQARNVSILLPLWQVSDRLRSQSSTRMFHGLPMAGQMTGWRPLISKKSAK